MSVSLNRRQVLGGCCGVAAAVTALGIPAPLRASPMPKNTLTPDEALAKLKDGNQKFVAAGGQCYEKMGELRKELAGGQAPFAIIVSCADSRVPPELIFDAGLGELFIIRVAGNTVDTVGMGSMEYAVEHLGTPLVVIMGHQKCGAVGAAVEVVEKNVVLPGSMGPMVEPIIPAVLAARSQSGDLTTNAIRENVRRTVSRLRSSSEPIWHEPLHAGKLRVVGACYDLETGAVDFFLET